VSLSVSVVIVTHNEGDNLRRTVEATRATVPDSTEIVVIDDASTDGSAERLESEPGIVIERPDRPLGISAGRNHGAKRSSGEVIIFSDAHVQPLQGWFAPLVEALDDPTVAEVTPAISHLDGRPGIGYGFTWPDISMRMKWLAAPGERPVDVPFVCGCFLAVRRDAFDEVGGFDEGMYRWGSEDAELSLRFWLSGYRCQVVPTAEAMHLFRDRFPYEVDHSGILSNVLRLAVLHFGAVGIERVVSHHARRDVFAGAWTRLLDSDAWQRRRELDSRRSHDIEWFARKFGIDAIS
jgi:GT2 family glycosyltransferase